jgi:hypothetical protein
MSRHTEKLHFPIHNEQMMVIVQDAVASANLQVLRSGEDYIVCKEASSQVTSFTWPAEIRVELSSYQDGKGIEILLKGKIAGFGPIQSNHLEGQMGSLCNRISLLAKRYLNQIEEEKSRPKSEDLSLVDKLERLAQLLEKGVLSKEEFTRAKSKLLSE